MNQSIRAFLAVLALSLIVCVPGMGRQTASGPTPDSDWQRVTAHLNGVFAPRGFFNIIVSLYSLPSLRSVQCNLKQSSIVMDFPPGTPPITTEEIQHVEKLAGYRPGPVEVQRIPVQAFAENGPGWIKMKHPQSRNAFIRWVKQNF